MTKEQIKKLEEQKKLLDAGILTQNEFESEKLSITECKSKTSIIHFLKFIRGKKGWVSLAVAIFAIVVIIIFAASTWNRKQYEAYETLKGLSVGVDVDTFAKQFQASGLSNTQIDMPKNGDADTMYGYKIDELQGKVASIKMHSENSIITKLTFRFIVEPSYETNKNVIPIIRSYLENRYNQKDECTYTKDNLTITIYRDEYGYYECVNVEYSIE